MEKEKAQSQGMSCLTSMSSELNQNFFFLILVIKLYRIIYTFIYKVALSFYRLYTRPFMHPLSLLKLERLHMRHVWIRKKQRKYEL